MVQSCYICIVNEKDDGSWTAYLGATREPIAFGSSLHTLCQNLTEAIRIRHRHTELNSEPTEVAESKAA